ncbi:MAG: tyrosine-type recombinase/integrase [Hylemonella sp.]
MRLPVPRHHPALLPEQLDALTQKAVLELMREGESPNTQLSYRSALRYWAAWYGLRYGRLITLPLPAPCVLQFIVDHAQRSGEQGLTSELPHEIDLALVAAGYKGKTGALALATLVHRIAVLSKAHQARELKNPCQDPLVRELLARTRKAYARRGALPHKKAALTREPLEALLATCDHSLRGRRDRALLLFAWSSGGRRRSEVAHADMAQLRRYGPGEFVYTLAHSKSNQAGTDQPENHKPLVGVAAEALEAWLQASGVKDGPIFRRIRRGGHLGPGLTPAAVRDIVLARCVLAGVEGDFSAHSLRSGFVTEAGRQNLPLGETMALTGHHNVTTVLGYFRAAPGAASDKVKRLLD